MPVKRSRKRPRNYDSLRAERSRLEKIKKKALSIAKKSKKSKGKRESMIENEGEAVASHGKQTKVRNFC